MLANRNEPLDWPLNEDILNPSSSWENKADYDKKYKELAGLFAENFKKFNIRNKTIVNAGPNI